MMINLGTIFLQASGGGGAINFLFLGAMFVIFYFFLIRPQAKKQKQQRNFEAELEKGTEVVTASGIYGKINKIEGEIITLEIANKIFIRVTKNSISKEMTEGTTTAK